MLTGLSLTLMDVGYAALLALLLMWIYIIIVKIFRLLVKPLAFHFDEKEWDKILQSCCALFPEESVTIRGAVYRRGMCLRIVTGQRRAFEGELIGRNRDDMICLLSRRCLLAHDVKHIESITII